MTDDELRLQRRLLEARSHLDALVHILHDCGYTDGDDSAEDLRDLLESIWENRNG